MLPSAWGRGAPGKGKLRELPSEWGLLRSAACDFLRLLPCSLPGSLC